MAESREDEEDLVEHRGFRSLTLTFHCIGVEGQICLSEQEIARVFFLSFPPPLEDCLARIVSGAQDG